MKIMYHMQVVYSTQYNGLYFYQYGEYAVKRSFAPEAAPNFELQNFNTNNAYL